MTNFFDSRAVTDDEVKMKKKEQQAEISEMRQV